MRTVEKYQKDDICKVNIEEFSEYLAYMIQDYQIMSNPDERRTRDERFLPILLLPNHVMPLVKSNRFSVTISLLVWYTIVLHSKMTAMDHV